MPLNAEVMRLIERRTGKTIEQLQSGTIAERRCEIETEQGRPMRLRKLPLFLGRGAALGDFLLTRSEVDRQLDRALR